MKRFGVKFWQLILGILCICIIVLGVWIVIININRAVEENADDSVSMEGAQTAYEVDDAVYEILDRFKNDPEYGEADAKKDFAELIDNASDNGKIYAIIAFANFMLDQAGDASSAITLMENIENEVGDDLKAGFYYSFSELYRRAGRNEDAERYRILATELYKGYDAV